MTNLRSGAKASGRRFLSHLLSHARTKGAATHQPSGNALGNAITQQTFRALKARHRSEFRAFSAAACVGDTQTQGGASLCPGLTSSGTFGAKLDRVDQNAHCVSGFLSPNAKLSDDEERARNGWPGTVA